jgi:uncharacterized protein YfaS (alpha-2-macroglobulin family)
MKHLVLFFLLLILSACQKDLTNNNKPSSDTKKNDLRNQSDNITVTPAPFDSFPSYGKFPVAFRFTDAIAPADRGNPKNFENLSVTPNKFGNWYWSSESELKFEPQEDWKQGEIVNFDLTKLVVNQNANARKIFNPNKYELKLPSVDAHIVTCQLKVQNKTPLVQYPQFDLRFNYAIDSKNLSNYLELVLVENQKESKLELTTNYLDSYGFSASFKGPELFKPDSSAQLRFRIKKGLNFVAGGSLGDAKECSIPYSPEVWTKVSDELENTKNEKPLVIIKTKPLIKDFEETKKVSSLELNFTKAWSTESVNHGMAKGLVLEQGFKFEPELKGQWKTDLIDNSKFIFTPEEDWPIGQKYKVKVEPTVFKNFTLKEQEIEITTPSLKTRLYSASLYTDPNNYLLRKALATLDFTHIPKLDILEQKLTAKIRHEPNKDFSNAKSLKVYIKQNEKKLAQIFLETEHIELGDEPAEVLFDLASGMEAVKLGMPSQDTQVLHLTIPSKQEVFRITNTSLNVVKNSNEQLERVLSVEVSEPLDALKLKEVISLYELPDCKVKANQKICGKEEQFASESRITKEVIAKSKMLPLEVVAQDEKNAPNLFNFTFSSEGNREIFIEINNTLKSKTNFTLAKNYRNVLFAKQFEKELSIMHNGSLLSITGDRTLGIALRNIKKIEYELSRVLPNNLHHLVSVTSGKFSDPYFHTWAVGPDQLSETYRYQESFPDRDPAKTFYTNVNFDRFINKKELPKGLFLLNIKEQLNENERYNPNCQSEYYEDCVVSALESKRLVLISDLGLLVKNAGSGEQSLYVMSFRTGKAVIGATVKLLGQNGIPLFTEITDASGKVTFPNTKDFKKEKTPLLYTAQLGEDLSFLPFNRYDRQLNFSRFDIQGVYNSDEPEGLRAQIFTDRGIYRPSEVAKFGIIIRNRDLSEVRADLPLELSIRDPRGVEVHKSKYILSALGLDEFTWPTPTNTGTYTISVNLIRNNDGYENINTLSSANFRVEEFQPDKLVVKSQYVNDNKSEEFWSKQTGSFKVNVQNLFGTPATNNKVSAKLQVSTWDGSFSQYPDFSFYRIKEQNSLPTNPDDLGETKTSNLGDALYPIDLSKYAEKVFQVEFLAEAFEKESGRSVISTSKALITNSDYLLGWKADGRLDYINKDAKRKIDLLAIDATLKKINLSGVTFRLEEIRQVSTLVKQPNGTLQYQLTPKVIALAEEKINIVDNDNQYYLKTNEAGQYRLSIYNDTGDNLAEINYTVIGESNKSFMADRAAEVGLKLSKNSLEKGQELELSINVPYTGAGLITIERDKVYAQKWFKTDTLSTVEKITVPNDIIGNAYVSVAFVRSLDSKEIYSSPLSYAVRPFFVSQSEYENKIELKTPQTVIPGEEFEVEYKLSSPAKILLYAVDEGILQFARYRTPNPISHFIPKRALEVDTFQILDLILPDYGIVSDLISVGGDEDVGLGKFKNPFSRKKKAPMTYWSGIIPSGATNGKIKIPVPEYYNGTIRIIAINASENKLGMSEVKTIAQSDLVIEPQMPYFVAPNDEFEVGATIANTLKDSGDKVPVKISVDLTKGLQLVGNQSADLNIPANTDKAVKFKIKALQHLGEQQVIFKAEGLGKLFKADETISLRPASVVRTTIQTGSVISTDNQATQKEIDIRRALFKENSERRVSVSSSPLTFIEALNTYLKSYPYGCTEQLVSTAFPAVLFAGDPDFDTNQDDLNRYMKRALHAITTRQRADGSIGLWDSISESDPLFSLYALHFLIEARDNGFSIPDETFSRLNNWSKELYISRSYDQLMQLAQSYALYLQARQGERITKYATSLVTELDRQWKDSWRQTASAVFLAGTFKLLQMDREATSLNIKTDKVWNSKFNWPLNDAPLFLSVKTYILAKHFAEDNLKDLEENLINLGDYVNTEANNSFSSGFSILALDAYSNAMQTVNNSSIGAVANNANVSLSGNRILSGLLDNNVNKVLLSNKQGSLFYQLSETGADLGEIKDYQNEMSINRELRNDQKELISKLDLSQKLEVSLFINAQRELNNIAVVELLPGGFEIDLSEEGLGSRKSLEQKPNTWNPEYIDIQEDRIIFYGDLPKDTVTFTYRLKPLSKGKFVFPAPFAEGMYDRKVGSYGVSNLISID